MTVRYLMMALFVSTGANAWAQQCPSPPTAIDPSIDVGYEFNKKDKTYTYTYKIRNGNRAQVEIFLIQLGLSQETEIVVVPKDWRVKYQQSQADGKKLLMFSSSINSLGRGSSEFVYKIRSTLRPGHVQYFMEGSPQDALPSITVNGDDEVAVTCPGFYTEKTAEEERVTGYTIGPVAADQLDVNLKLKVKKDRAPKGWDDEQDNPEISAIDKGKVEVLMTAEKDVDLSKVDLQSIRFGPAKIVPLTAKYGTKGEHCSHWKKRPASGRQYIWMEFNLADLQIRCDIDKALFLTAKAGTQKVYGASSIKPVLCDKDIWKQMAKDRKWNSSHDTH